MSVRLNGQLPRSNVLVPTPDAPAPVSDLTRGRTIEAVLRTREFLLLRFTDGFEVRVSWHSLEGAGRLEGIPMVEELRRWK